MTTRPERKGIKLLCHCCAEPVGPQFALVTMTSDPTDRVYVFKAEHVNRADSWRYLEITVNEPDGL